MVKKQTGKSKMSLEELQEKIENEPSPQRSSWAEDDEAPISREQQNQQPPQPRQYQQQYHQEQESEEGAPAAQYQQRERREPREPREPRPIPDEAPFTAFVGNLSWEVDEQDLRAFFSSYNVLSVRVMRDRETGRSKGNAYVDFGDRASLVDAISLNNNPELSIKGRQPRFDVAEARRVDTTRPPRRDFDDRAPRREGAPSRPPRDNSRDFEGNWRDKTSGPPPRQYPVREDRPPRRDRETSDNAAPAPAPAAAEKPKRSNPFGDAKPKDFSTVDQKIAAKVEEENRKLAEETKKAEEERRQQREAEKKPAASARPESERKPREDNRPPKKAEDNQKWDNVRTEKTEKAEKKPAAAAAAVTDAPVASATPAPAAPVTEKTTPAAVAAADEWNVAGKSRKSDKQHRQ